MGRWWAVGWMVVGSLGCDSNDSSSSEPDESDRSPRVFVVVVLCGEVEVDGEEGEDKGPGDVGRCLIIGTVVERVRVVTVAGMVVVARISTPGCLPSCSGLPLEVLV